MFRNVFIIDDDPISNLVSVNMVKQAEIGEIIKSYNNPKAALKDLMISNPSRNDLIILDIIMPEMMGWGFITELERLYPNNDTKILLVTSSINPDDINEVKNHANILDLVSKPLSVDYLKDLV